MAEELSSVIEFSEEIATAEMPSPLPKAKYIGTIRTAERKESSKGNSYAAVTFFIAPDQYPADYVDGDPDGTLLTYNRVQLEDNARNRARIRKFCEAIGAPMAGRTVDLNSWLGLTAELEVTHEEFEGETRAVIKKVARE